LTVTRPMPVNMDARVTSLEDMPLIEAWGDIDHNTCGSIEVALNEALETGTTNVLLDLSDVTYIDSGGLSVLLSGVRLLRDRGWLGVIGPNPNVRRLLEIVGLLVDPNFKVFEDRQMAAAAAAGQVSS
jgi:anti-sigma B factor antagonist